MEKGKSGYNWRREHFSQSIGTWGDPFFPLLSVWAVSHRETPPSRVHTCSPDRVCVCLHSNIQYESMDSYSSDYLCSTTGNERDDWWIVVTIAAPHTEKLVYWQRKTSWVKWMGCTPPPVPPLLQQMCPCAKCWTPHCCRGAALWWTAHGCSSQVSVCARRNLNPLQLLCFFHVTAINGYMSVNFP